MVPKSSSPIFLKVSSKGLCWIDLMYQKFEAICEEVDKDHTLLMQETTKYVENQMSAVGTNVQKFFADFMEDIMPPAPEIDIKCLSLKGSVDCTENCKLSEQSEPEKENIQAENSQYPDSPLRHHEAVFEMTASDTADTAIQLGSPNPQEENISAKSISQKPTQKKTMDCDIEVDPSGDQFEDKRTLQETICLYENAEHLVWQAIPLVKFESMLLADRTDDAEIESPAEQAGVGSLDNACKIQLGGSPSPGDRYIKEKRTLKENFEETATDKLDNLNGDGERFLSVVEPSIANTPSCSKEGDLKECLSVEVNEKEQTAYWYEKEYVQTQDGIDESFSSHLVDVAVTNECPSAEISDSDWEVL